MDGDGKKRLALRSCLLKPDKEQHMETHCKGLFLNFCVHFNPE